MKKPLQFYVPTPDKYFETIPVVLKSTPILRYAREGFYCSRPLSGVPVSWINLNLDDLTKGIKEIEDAYKKINLDPIWECQGNRLNGLLEIMRHKKGGESLLLAPIVAAAELGFTYFPKIDEGFVSIMEMVYMGQSNDMDKTYGVGMAPWE